MSYFLPVAMVTQYTDSPLGKQESKWPAWKAASGQTHLSEEDTLYSNVVIQIALVTVLLKYLVI